MCAFDEFADKEPNSTQQVFKEAQSASRDLCDRPSSHKLMQGDVWLGTDEDLIRFLAASEPELLQSPSPTSECTFPLHERTPDNRFLVNLASISNRNALVQSPVEEHLPAGSSSIVILSPGKKRVLPSPPNNNPFKLGKLLDEAPNKSIKAPLPFNPKLDGQLSCREDQCLDNAIWVPVHNPQDEAQGLIVTGESADAKARGSRSLMFNNAGVFQASVHWELATPAPLFVQHSESQSDDDRRSNRNAQKAGDSLVSVQLEPKVSSSVGADVFFVQPVRRQYASNLEAAVRQEQLLVSLVRQDSAEQQRTLEAYADSTSHRISSSLPMRAGTDDPKTPTLITNQLQREAKAKKQIRSSSKQSSKVVMAASTPSLLKFFQRAPTL